MRLNDYQNAAITTRKPPAITNEKDPIISLLGLAGEAGELISEYKKYLRDGDAYKPFKERVREELGDMLWYIASLAEEYNIPLSDVADFNLQKCRERWGNIESGDLPYFDEGFPAKEQFPRRLQVVLLTVDVEGRQKLRMLLQDGSTLGNDLTDNSYEEDGYRFHDVFHLACMAMLRWSPVIRKLLECKRRSHHEINEVEDGGRATAIEEGISALVFSYARQRAHLDGVDKVDYELLRTIKGMTVGLEVDACSARDWERVILATYSVWREVVKKSAGIIDLDLEARIITLR